jgi:Tol biopolymer transport system component/predicted Ser/Thr protein kinase
MELAPGTSLGPYKILALLGAGGMGEVYRAQDSRLGREVAIKILPALFARDDDRRGRFEREARILASLSHPNIATLHGLQEFDNRSLLEMELVPGEDLAERLRRGPMTLADGLPVFKQVAQALEAAHDHGIIHRDLKPANVKLTPDGRVKVLDFGLAKAFESESSETQRSQSPTYVTMSHPGMILGTAAYMSPEQVRGKVLDRRTDIWSFGCMLYEALAGRPPFAGDTVTEILATILKEDADWSALPPIPSPIERVLRRCLRKDPQARLRDIADARVEIEDALGESSPALIQPRPAERARSGWRAWIVGAAVISVLVLGAVATWLVGIRGASRPQQMARFVIPLQPDQRLESALAAPLAIAPDGRTLVYVAVQPAGRTQLFLRGLDQFDATALPGTEGGSAPFFSADGRWVGFYGNSGLQKVSLAGGPALKICDAPAVWSATWTPDDTIIFATTLRPDGLWQVSAAGGTPEPLTKPDAQKGELQHAYPQVLSDGTRVLLSIVGEQDWRLAILSLKTRELQRIGQGGPTGVGARFVSTGHVIYAQAGGLLAVPFSASSGQITGAPIPMLERIDMARSGSANFAVSANGSLAYLPGRASLPSRTLLLVDRDGRATSLSDVRAPYSHPRFSRDGTRLAVAIDSEAGSDVWIYDLRRGTRTRLTGGGSNGFPEWSADGAQVTFQSARSGPSASLFSTPRDGSGVPQPLISGLSSPDNSAWTRGTAGLLPGSVPTLTGANPHFPMSWSPDGGVLAFDERKPNAERDIWTLVPGSSPSPFLLTPFDEHSPVFSPDGRWLAYVSDESGRAEVYVQPYPGPGGKWPISSDGGTDPAWSPDGGELFYRHGDGLVSVPIQVKSEFQAGRPKPLFESRYEAQDGARNYDVAPDGHHFVVVRADNATQPTEFRMVINWFEELRARVPAP